MGRVLFFLILAVVVYVVIKGWWRKQIQNEKSPLHLSGKSHSGVNPHAHMQACLHCGTWSPQAEGVMIQGRFYCTLEHARAGGELLGKS